MTLKFAGTMGSFIQPKRRTRQFAPEKILVWILRFGTSACFLGWAWQLLYWEGPYKTVLWNPTIFSLLEGFGLDWDAIVGQGSGGGVVQQFSRWVGWLMLACGFLSISVKRGSYLQMAGLCTGSVFLLLAAYGKYILSHRQHAMLAEHAGQILMPMILIMAVQLGCRFRATRWLALVALVLTFAGHGAYAVGLEPTPGHFIGMIRVVLLVPADWALVILRIAGWLDFAICVAVLIPYLRGPALLYAAVWGALTALARPLSGMGADLIYWGADQFLHEALYRMPHAVIPFFLFWSYRKQFWSTTGAETPSEVNASCCISHQPVSE